MKFFGMVSVLDSEVGFSFLVIYFTSNDFSFFFLGPFMKVGTFFVLVLWIQGLVTDSWLYAFDVQN